MSILVKVVPRGWPSNVAAARGAVSGRWKGNAECVKFNVVLELHDVLNLDRDGLGWCNGAERGCEDIGVCCWRRPAGSLLVTAVRKSVVAWSSYSTMPWMKVVLMVQQNETMTEDPKIGKVYWVSVIGEDVKV
jgi:sugar lactone lactonase YvrE